MIFYEFSDFSDFPYCGPIVAQLGSCCFHWSRSARICFCELRPVITEHSDSHSKLVQSLGSIISVQVAICYCWRHQLSNTRAPCRQKYKNFGKPIDNWFVIGFGLEKGSGMVIRIGFVGREGREHPQWRNLPIQSRIRGPDVIILSRNRFLQKSHV